GATGCDPSPPSYVGLSRASSGEVVAIIDPCHDLKVTSAQIAPTGDIVLDEAKGAAHAVWRIDTDVPQPLRQIDAGHVPVGYNLEVDRLAGVDERDYRFEVFFEHDRGDAVPLSFLDKVTDPNSVVESDGSVVPRSDFLQCT